MMRVTEAAPEPGSQSRRPGATARPAAIRPALARAGLALLLAVATGSGALPARVGKAGSPGIPGKASDSSSAVAGPIRGPRIHLSWGAPYGSPRAREDVELTCGDTSLVDTLYMCLVPEENLERFNGVWGHILFHPRLGDTLRAFWDFRHEGANPGSLKVQFDPDSTFPGPRPWAHNGGGGVSYEFGRAVGTLLMGYAVQPEDAAPVQRGTQYVLGRILLEHRRCDLPGARQPVCIDWEEARYDDGYPPVYVVSRSPGSCVSVNSPDGRVRALYEDSRRLPRSGPAE